MVERFNFIPENTHSPAIMEEDEKGDWVRYFDYADLERQIAELRARAEMWHKLYQRAVVRENEVTAERDSLAADKARLSEALEPLAKFIGAYDCADEDGCYDDQSLITVSLGKLRALRAALSGSGAGGWRELREAFEAARYQPGDHPIIPVKIDRFMKTVERLLAAPTATEVRK